MESLFGKKNKTGNTEPSKIAGSHNGKTKTGSSKTTFMKTVFIFLCLLVTCVITITYATSYLFTQNAGAPHILGNFYTNGSGNAGTIFFDKLGGTAALEGVTLTGSFYLETVGWVTFNSNARIIPPVSGLVTDHWTITGTLASPYSGIIYLNSGALYKTKYDPVTKKLIGAAWNLGIGKIPFDNSGNQSTGFLGKVKILGNIGGNKSFDTFNPLGSRLNISVINDTLNQIRKNTALLSRNISGAQMNTTFGLNTPVPIDDKIFFINTGVTIKTLKYSDIRLDFPSKVDSIIIIGGDIIIDVDINNSFLKPKGIIVLKNSIGVGGNTIITKNVRKIESSLFNEASIYSGDNKLNLYNDTTEKAALLSRDITKQLYIYGSVISRNTIGGSIQSTGAICVYEENNCTYEKAIRYDFNYFRGYDGTPGNRAFRNSSLDAYSFIIESDPRTSNLPPPGFEYIKSISFM